MTKTEALYRFRHEIRKRNKAYTTEKTYLHWISRYSDYLRIHPGDGPDDYLTFLADPPDRAAHPVSMSTQRNALNALAKFHEWVLDRPMGKLTFQPARKHRKVPDFLTLSECHSLFGQMKGIPQLQSQLMFGTGLRVSECLALRIKDLDFSHHTLTVRDGKGGKDRVVPLPRCLVPDLLEQIEKANHFWKVDRTAGHPAPYLPDSLARKLGRQASEFPWFWLFPASGLSTDPRSGIVRRHHLTDAGIAKAIRIATRRAGLTKRVTPHVMRHSFATQSLQNGLDIKSLATLLGHKSIATTEIYLHCLPSLAFRAVSPLDQPTGNIVAAAFTQSPTAETRGACSA